MGIGDGAMKNELSPLCDNDADGEPILREVAPIGVSAPKKDAPGPFQRELSAMIARQKCHTVGKTSTFHWFSIY